MVGAVKDGVIAEFAALLEAVRLQLHDHACGFAFIVAADADLDRVAVAQFRPQGFLEQLLVMCDDVVGSLQDTHCRPVVLFQFDDFQTREFIRQFFQIGDVGTAPAVNGLIVIAHRSELLAYAGELLEQLVLAGVGVLVFIDQQVAQAVLPLLGNVRMRCEQSYRQADQVVEINRLVGFQGGFVTQVSIGGERFVFVAGDLAGGFRADQRVFPVGDDGLQVAQC